MVGNDKKMHGLDNGDQVAANADCIFTQLALPNNNSYLFAGTASGAIRVYPWPLRFSDGSLPMPIAEFHMHSCAITDMRISTDQRYLFSSAEDGTIFAYAIREIEGERERPWEKPKRSQYNAAIVLRLREDVEETVRRSAVLRWAKTIGPRFALLSLHGMTGRVVAALT